MAISLTRIFTNALQTRTTETIPSAFPCLGDCAETPTSLTQLYLHCREKKKETKAAFTILWVNRKLIYKPAIEVDGEERTLYHMTPP